MILSIYCEFIVIGLYFIVLDLIVVNNIIYFLYMYEKPHVTYSTYYTTCENFAGIELNSYSWVI